MTHPNSSCDALKCMHMHLPIGYNKFAKTFRAYAKIIRKPIIPLAPETFLPTGRTLPRPREKPKLRSLLVLGLGLGLEFRVRT